MKRKNKSNCMFHIQIAHEPKMNLDPKIEPNDTSLQRKDGCHFNRFIQILISITVVCCLVAIVIPLSITYGGTGNQWLLFITRILVKFLKKCTNI